MSKAARALENLFANASLGAPENAIGFVLWRLLHRYQRELDRELAVIDLTHLQFTVLSLAAWLARSGELVTQADLARFGDIHPMQVSHILKTLESKNMVRRLRSGSDVRAKEISVTSSGLRVLRRAFPIAIDVQQRLFGDAGQPGGELLKVLNRLDGGEPAQAPQSAVKNDPPE